MTTPRRTIVVTAATGRQGRAATTALLERGWPVRALVRDPGSAPAATLMTPPRSRPRSAALTACSSTSQGSCLPS